MKTLFKILFIGIALLMLTSLLGAILGGWGLFGHPGHGMHIVLGDEELMLGGGDFGDWLGAGIGLLVAGVVCLVVLPLVLLLGVALPLVIVGGVLALVVLAFAGVGALLGSPLIVLALLAFIVLRNRSRANAAKSAAL